MEDWTEYLKSQCMENELLAFNVRKKGKSLKVHSSASDMVVQESADGRQGYYQGGRCISRKGYTGDSGDGNCEADHPGILSGKVGRADEEKKQLKKSRISD